MLTDSVDKSSPAFFVFVLLFVCLHYLSEEFNCNILELGNLSYRLFNSNIINCKSEISNAFRPGKAAGHDRIPISIIKQSIQILADPLTHIIKLSITHGIVPDQMKIVRVIPLFKAGDRSLLWQRYYKCLHSFFCVNYRQKKQLNDRNSVVYLF